MLYLLAALAVLGQAAPQAACARPENPLEITITSEARLELPSAWRSVNGECRLVVWDAEGSGALRYRIRAEGAIEAVDAVSGVSLEPDAVGGAVATGRMLPAFSDRTLPVNLEVTAASTPWPMPIHLVRRPAVTFGSPEVHSCLPGSICLPPSGPGEVELRGRNLAELALDSVVLRGDGGRARVPVGPDGRFLTLDGAGTHTFEFQTRSPWCEPPGAAGTRADACSRRSFEVTVLLERVGYDSGELSLTVDGQPLHEILVGQGARVRFALHEANAPLSGTYPLVPQRMGSSGALAAPGEAHAFLEVRCPGGCEEGEAYLVGTRPVTSPFKDQAPRLAAYDGDEEIFTTHLEVLPQPSVRSVRVVHASPHYQTPAIHPLERVTVVLEGINLEAYDLPPVVPTDMAELESVEKPGPRLHEVELRVRPNARGRMGMTLRSTTVPDTTLWLDVVPNQRPRPLTGFGALQHTRRRGFWGSLKDWLGSGTAARDTASLKQAVVATGRLHGAELLFHDDSVDVGDALYGPQYLVVRAFLRSPAGEEISADSARVVVVPRSGDYRVLPGYAPVTRLLVDDLVKDLSRHSRFGSRLTLEIRHDSARYETASGEMRRFELRNTHQFRVEPYAAVLGGMLYLARVAENERRPVPLPNGFGADTLIHYERTRDLRFDALSVAGAGGIEIARLREDGRASPLRARLGLTILESPFSEKRDVGVSAVYPIELFDLRGGVSLGVSIGALRMLREGEWLWLLSPGFSIPLRGN